MTGVVTVTDISLSFPILPAPCLDRAHNLQTISQMFTSGARIVVVTGEPDIGKTTTLAQFALSKRNSVLCFFLKSISDLAYDLTQLRYDLCNQVEYIVSGRQLDSSYVPSQPETRQAILRLVRHARQIKNTLYFIVDGLIDIPEANSEALNWFCDVLPLNMESFRLLLSGDIDKLPPSIQSAEGLKPFVLGGFTVDEQQRALADCSLDESQLAAICRFCNGSPGVTQSVRRLLLQGHDPQAILDLESDEARTLFKEEWKRVSLSNEPQSVVLTLLSFFPNRCSTKSVSDLTGYTAEEIAGAIDGLSFIRTDASANTMMLASESVRRFAQSMLEPVKARALDVIISNLKKQPLNSQVTVLPEFLHHRGEWQTLLEYFDAPRLALLARESNSIGVVVDRTAMIASVAKRLGDWPNTVRFQLFEMTLRSVLETPPLLEEIRLALAQDDIARAITIATATASAEIRFRQFATIAKAQSVKEGRVASEVEEEIKRLSKLIDPEQIGDGYLEIAYDLLLALPDVSAQLVSRLAGTGDPANSLDVAIAKLSQRALSDRGNQTPDAALRAIADMAQPTASENLGAVSELFSTTPDAEKIFEASARIPSPSDRIWLIRGWLAEHSSRPDAISLSLKVAKEIIGDALYSPNAGVFADLAKPLVSNAQHSLAAELAGLLRSQVPAIQAVGPTVDAFRVLEILATYEHRINAPAARAIFDDLVLTADEIVDLGTRAAVLATLYGRRDVRAQDGRTLLEHYGIDEFVVDSLKRDVTRLLAGTFEHDVVLASILASVSFCDWADIKDILDQVNTAERRDAALVRVIRALCRQNERDGLATTPWWAKINNALSMISGVSAADAALLAVVRAHSRRELLAAEADVGRLEEMSLAIGSVQSRAQALANVISICCRQPSNHTRKTQLMSRLVDALGCIDGKRECTTTMHYCHTEIAKVDAATATEFKSQCIQRMLGQETPGSSYWPVFANLAALAGRIYAHLEAAHLVSEVDRRRLERVIEAIDPIEVRLEIWAVIALRLSNAGCDHYEAIWTDRVVPLTKILEAYKESDPPYWAKIVINLFPLAWLMNQANAKALLIGIPPEFQERAVKRAVSFVGKKKIPGEPFDSPADAVWSLTREKIDELLELAQLTESDEIVYLITSQILRFMATTMGKAECTKGARQEYARRIEILFTTALPSAKRHIRHNGYVILCKAELHKYNRADSNAWDVLIAEAKNLPNSADSSLVLSELTRLIPSQLSSLRESAYAEAEKTLERIESIEDRLSRALQLCEHAPSELSGRAKKTAKRAYEYLQGVPEHRYESALRGFIDSIYHIDPTFAESIAGLLENDPARRYAKQIAREQINIQQQAKSNALVKSGEVMQKARIKQANAASWKQLAKVNATRSSPLGVAGIEDLFDTVAHTSFKNGYGIASLAVSTSPVLFRSAEQMKDKVFPVLQALLDAHELCAELRPILMAHGATRGTSPAAESEDLYSLVVGPGERSEALQTVRKWLGDMQPNSVCICDPYLAGFDDLDALLLVCEAAPQANIEMLVGHPFRAFVGKIATGDAALGPTLEDRWGKGKVPYVRIVSVVIANTERSPIHDRWWITDKGVIEMGTSFGGIGLERIAKIRLVSVEDVGGEVRLIPDMMTGSRRQHRGEWLSYLVHTVLPGAQ